MASMAGLAPMPGLPAVDEPGFPTIQSNVCREILEALAGESVERLYGLVFQFAKDLAS